MSTHRRCAACGEWGWFDTDFLAHRCSPAWECRLEDGGDEWWDTVRALDAESAAEKFAEQYDCTGGEYSIVGGRHSDCIVLVRKPASDDSDDTDAPEPVTRWAIHAEAVPTYRATAVTSGRSPE